MHYPLFRAALGLLFLWVILAQAQEQSFAIKLNNVAYVRQRSNSSFISSLIKRVGYNGQEPKSVAVKPLFRQDLLAKIDRQATNNQRHSLDRWYEVKIVPAPEPVVVLRRNDTLSEDPAQGDKIPAYVVKFMQDLIKLQEITNIHPLLDHDDPQVDTINPADDPRSGRQGYLDPAPGGIDARYAWRVPGGTGRGVTVVDLEQGFNLDHEDLPRNIDLIGGHIIASSRFHGTGVLGELFMVDNKIGGVGIVPNARGRVVSYGTASGGEDIPNAILEAVAVLHFGDILLLEVQTRDPVTGTRGWPVEIRDEIFEEIQYATSLGITVIEAAGNGGYDLDNYQNIEGDRIFFRQGGLRSGFRESGAVMVGAASSTVPHTRMWFSNHGSRVDVYAWGENVATAFANTTIGVNNLYTDTFNGTSSASGIIAGAAAAAQGMSVAHRNIRLSPQQMRTILQVNGTQSRNPGVDRIGVMPNLRSIADQIANPDGQFAVDVYFRDQVGDVGLVPTTGGVYRSPDIIVRQWPYVNPSTALGTGSGTEDNVALSHDVVSGREHSLYVRVQNRGTADTSQDTEVKLWWSRPTTLNTPNLWNFIGTALIRAPVRGSRQRFSVSDRLAWPANRLPPALPNQKDHYCFVAIADTPNQDPEPLLPQSFEQFDRFVKENNNVAWRNFNVLPAPANDTSPGGDPSMPGFHRLIVYVPGAWDSD